MKDWLRDGLNVLFGGLLFVVAAALTGDEPPGWAIIMFCIVYGGLSQIKGELANIMRKMDR